MLVKSIHFFSHVRLFRTGQEGAQEELYWLLTVSTWKQELDNNLVLGDRHVGSWRGGVRTYQFLTNTPTWWGLAVGTCQKHLAVGNSNKTHLVVANSP